MIKKLLLLLYFMFIVTSFSQEIDSTEAVVEESTYNYYKNKQDKAVFKNDSLYEKTINFEKQRTFKEKLNDKYKGDDFTYIENEPPPPKKKQSIPKSTGNFNFTGLLNFLGNVFPYLLGLIVILIILRAYVDTEKGFWSFGKLKRKQKEQLVYDENEAIEETDFDKHLRLAIKNKDYRLATRFYYLATLQKLANNELIDFHKDKTNTEYLFELKEDTKRKQFSRLSYIYDYVWYGEFEVDKDKFSIIESTYKSFINTI